ncbi:hypothetical protein [Streptomyces sp. 8L]|uniref:hypothetical protein n=1 Tax=Streptomyces sp. 8L TaxID=2877242 RepID=UPI001CD6E0F9|nr:hypothetical protein [Streptomyces sp. 8L]MCA1221408.1 hypothetical protein [Streptomyces sp. 8L]
MSPIPSQLDVELGPRRPGAVYQNVSGAFEVLALITDPIRAAQMLKRSSARWALVVRDVLRADGQPFVIGSVWTTSDYLVRPAKRTPSVTSAA